MPNRPRALALALAVVCGCVTDDDADALAEDDADEDVEFRAAPISSPGSLPANAAVRDTWTATCQNGGVVKLRIREDEVPADADVVKIHVWDGNGAEFQRPAPADGTFSTWVTTTELDAVIDVFHTAGVHENYTLGAGCLVNGAWGDAPMLELFHNNWSP